MENHGSSAAPIPTELVERLEAASVGSRELDRALYEVFRPTTDLEEYRKLFATDAEGYWFWMSEAAYTTSLDEALALAERVLPEGWGYKLTRTERGGHHTAVLHWSHPVNREIIADSARTAPLALCIAILKATTAAGPELGGYDCEAGVNQNHYQGA